MSRAGALGDPEPPAELGDAELRFGREAVEQIESGRDRLDAATRPALGPEGLFGLLVHLASRQDPLGGRLLRVGPART
jgi:hypothetical protein